MKFVSKAVVALCVLGVTAAEAKKTESVVRDQEDLVYWRGLVEDLASVPTSAPVAPVTTAPVATTDAPVAPVAPVATIAPVVPTDAPVAPVATIAPVPLPPISAPIAPVVPPVAAPTDAPVAVIPTDAPVAVIPTDAPVAAIPTAPVAVILTDAPVAVIPTDAPVAVIPTNAPVAAPTDAPIAPVTPTDAPVAVIPTDAPVAAPTDAPVAPVAPTVAPVAPTGTPVVRMRLEPYTLNGGAEFDDPNSYQSQALLKVEAQEGVADFSDEKLTQYYALYCIYNATNTVPNVITDMDPRFEGIPFPSWLVTTGWDQTTLDPCDGWFGITCDAQGRVSTIDLFENLLTGSFPPEVALLALDGPFSTGAGNLFRIDLFRNEFLYNNNDNSWFTDLGSNMSKYFLKHCTLTTTIFFSS
jgi:hypothetical protein